MKPSDLFETGPASRTGQHNGSSRSPKRVLGLTSDPQHGFLNAAVIAAGSSAQWVKSGAEALEFLGSPEAARISLVLVDAPFEFDDALVEIRRRFPHLPILTTLMTTLTDARGYPLLETCPVSEGSTRPAPPAILHGNADDEESDAVGRGGQFDLKVGWSQRITPVLKQVAAADAPVLVLGETGVGKEVLARYLHAHSPRAGRPFLKVNCAALPSELVESELFGYEKGAFTGAFGAKPGKFELASGGTILLDEIGDMEFRLQAKLLQVLQDHTFDRLGGRKSQQADVWIIAATHCDLEAAVRNRGFRQDLFYRLSVITVSVPPLRERKNEILPLCELFLHRYAQAGQPPPALPESLKEALLAHNWPGNVRELENVIRRLLVLRDPQSIERELRLRHSQEWATHREKGSWRPGSNVSHLRELPANPLECLENSKRESEAATIRAALERARWNRRKAADVLQISYKTLLYRMRKFGLTAQPHEPAAPLAPEEGEVSDHAGTASARSAPAGEE